ncbi:hypothetical protein WC29P3_00010 [Weissella phage WC29P3]|nr:hypothetical protein WC29P3_00010 [Weissella phage WC29P3]
MQQLGRLQQLERLQKLGRLQKLHNTKNEDYKYFSNVKNSILYLDPPYENSANAYQIGKFESNDFYDWAYKMSKRNTVIISSYEVSDERYEPVFEFENARSRLAPRGIGNRTEKLFMVKAGL